MTRIKSYSAPMNLKQMREAAGFTSQDAAAEATGLAQGTLSNLENGISTDIRISTLEALSREYKRSVEDVIEAIRVSKAEAA
jgi:transcriptional regulator with XRE-family HTH domain